MAAYLISNFDITNNEGYQSYVGAVVPTMLGHGGKILVAGSESEIIEGSPGAITVVLEFPTMENLHSWYDSPEYREIKALRTENTVGNVVFANEFIMPG